jgi:hypothetical protein
MGDVDVMVELVIGCGVENVVKERRGMESLAVFGFAIPFDFRCTRVIITLDSRIINPTLFCIGFLPLYTTGIILSPLIMHSSCTCVSYIPRERFHVQFTDFPSHSVYISCGIFMLSVWHVCFYRTSEKKLEVSKGYKKVHFIDKPCAQRAVLHTPVHLYVSSEAL